MKLRMISILLALALLLSIPAMAVKDPAQSQQDPLPAEAAAATQIVSQEILLTPADPVQAQGYTQHQSSESLVAYVKAHENTDQAVYFPYWDVSQWSIGYGSRCPSSPSVKNYTRANFPTQADYDKFLGYVENGMPQAEATALLRSLLNGTYDVAVNNMAQRHNVSLTQEQFDALVEFSYCLGSGWTSGSRLRTSLTRGDHTADWTAANSLDNPGWYFINALGTWCHVSSQPSHSTATRRVQDLELFRYGSYFNSYAALKAAGNGHVTYLFFDANGGQNVNPTGTGDWSTTNRFYFTGSPYGSLMDCQREGYHLTGWYTAPTGGTKITADTVAQLNTASSSFAGITVYAQWCPDSNLANGGCAVCGHGQSGFPDVTPGAFYADAVGWAVAEGITQGMPNGTFQPKASCTRAQVATFLYRAAGSPAVSGSNPFTDVKAGSFYENAVLWAAEAGITKGVTASTFCPEQTVTREQFVTFLYRYAGQPTVTGGSGFTDVTDGYYVNAVTWAAQNGITQGMTATTFGVGTPCQRGHVVTFLHRYFA